MNGKELSALIGTEVTWEPIAGLLVSCTITNAKFCYGHSRVEIEPLSGGGRAWIKASSVQAAPENPNQEGSQHGRS